MGVLIKAGDSAGATQGMYRMQLRDIARQADDVLSAARAEAGRIVEAARAQSIAEREAARDTGCREGYAAGRIEGYDAGLSAGRTEALAESAARFEAENGELGSAFKTLADQFEAQATQFSAERDRMHQAARRDAVVLAIAIAERVIGRLNEAESIVTQAAVTACEEALALLGQPEEMRVRLHPADASAWRRIVETGVHAPADASRVAAVWRSITSASHVQLIEDANVGRGGALVETPTCTIDARLAERVNRIADELAAEWRLRAGQMGLAESTVPDVAG